MSDLISRAAAIKAIKEDKIDLTNPNVGAVFKATGDFEKVETQVMTCDRHIKILKDFPSAQPEQRWIPCSEGLPEHGGRYLISVLDGINRRTTVSPYLPRCKAWSLTGRMAYWKVIAWMPLPEPYREVSE